MKKILIIALVLAALGLVACAGGSKSAESLVSKAESLAVQMADAVKAMDTGKITNLQAEFEGLSKDASTLKDSDFTPEQKTRLETAAAKMMEAMLSSLGGLGGALGGLGDALGDAMKEAGDAAGDAAAATTTP